MPVPHRLVTRSDFDGLVCAVLLRELGLVDEITFVHPKDVQDGKVAVTRNDILTNLPYVPEAHLVFDHHSSEGLRNGEPRPNHVLQVDAPSAARVVFDHFGGSASFPGVSAELMAAVDQADSAQYSLEDVLHPTGWTLLNFLMDSRTGLGRFRDLPGLQLRADDDAHRGGARPDRRRGARAARRRGAGRAVPRAARAVPRPAAPLLDRMGELVVLDLRHEDVIHAGNRFAIYAENPECTVSVHVLWGKQNQNTVLAVGKSILNRASAIDIGALMLSYGGGGHAAAGTCQLAHEDADRALLEIAAHVNAGSRVRRA